METENGAKGFPVVCVGGTAGGLDAYIRLLRHLPAAMGVAVVITVFMRSLTEALGRQTYRRHCLRL